MSKINIVSYKGINVGEKKIPDNVLVPKKINRHTIFESVNVENQNSRQGTHDTKNKSEVSGSGKKPYRQKHTGRARQGSRRNPHFRGGGVAFGPTPEKNYSIKVNKKVFKIALVSVWSQIIESNNVVVLDNSFEEFGYSTKSFSNFLKSMNLLNRKILCIFSEQEKQLINSSRNVINVQNRTPINCSVRDLLDQNFLIISEGSFDAFMERLSSWK